MTIAHIAVVVPARNEHELIERCVDSLDTACRNLAEGVTSTVIVVADCCSDDTASRARSALPSCEVVETTAGSVGAARLIGTEHGLQAPRFPLDEIWIATTDADTVVDRDWLTSQVSYANDDAIAVAGTVDLLDHHRLDPALIDRFRSVYTIHADGTHPHVHAANLGFRADAYRAVGGWNPLATGEDHDLWNRLRTHGPTVSTTAVCVHTSGRLTGRAPDGFAADLAALTDNAATVA